LNIWFTRSNGDTLHNNPNTQNYVEGEPPDFPKIYHNYRLECLHGGFARIGWPNTGDLLNNFDNRFAPDGYSFETIDPRYQRYLKLFSSILAGDLILIPGYEGISVVHLGIVLTKDRKKVLPYIEPRPSAYYYYYDISKQDWYECAHRVNVQWAQDENGEFMSYIEESIKINVWRTAFAQIRGENNIFNTAKKFGLF